MFQASASNEGTVTYDGWPPVAGGDLSALVRGTLCIWRFTNNRYHICFNTIFSTLFNCGYDDDDDDDYYYCYCYYYYYYYYYYQFCLVLSFSFCRRPDA